jgi:hypothetical protein
MNRKPPPSAAAMTTTPTTTPATMPATLVPPPLSSLSSSLLATSVGATVFSGKSSVVDVVFVLLDEDDVLSLPFACSTSSSTPVL